MGPTLKDLDACFLTFHSLHTPVSGQLLVLIMHNAFESCMMFVICLFGGYYMYAYIIYERLPNLNFTNGNDLGGCMQ